MGEEKFVHIETKYNMEIMVCPIAGWCPRDQGKELDLQEREKRREKKVSLHLARATSTDSDTGRDPPRGTEQGWICRRSWRGSVVRRPVWERWSSPTAKEQADGDEELDGQR
jgi:hypothetical protein